MVKTSKNYYDVDQEKAVLLFLEAETAEEKTKIYREYLHKPINTMIESIIRRYKLYRKTYEFNDLHADALGFLMTKFHKFKPEKNKKSFSYFGTIAKNYLKGEMLKDSKKQKQMTDIDPSHPELLKRDDLLYTIDGEPFDAGLFIERLTDKLKEEIDSSDLNDNEFKVGHSLVKILEEWEELFANDENKNSPKFNKNLVLLYIRNMTGLTTKEIRNSMKRFKTIYSVFKNDYIED